MLQPKPFQRSSYDVIIVGARCAGAATAMLLARAGVKVLAIDRQGYGSDTLSTHALMRPAVIQLARWQLLDDVVASGAPLIRSTTFHYGEDVVEVRIDPTPNIPGLIAPRRSVLDRILVDAARAAGAEVVHDTAARHLVRDSGGRVSGVVVSDAAGGRTTLNASLVIGADGLASMVAREAGADIVYRGEASTATMYVYTANPGLDGYHWYFNAQSAVGVIPTNKGEMCVFAAVSTAQFDSLRHLDAVGRHAAVLAGLAPRVLDHIATSGASVPRAFRGEPAVVRRACGPGWLLVGDAGLFRDPITSHGISDALRDAEAAARAVLDGSASALSRFEEERDAIALPVIEATNAICAFDWSLDELKRHHKRLSLAMKAEVEVLSGRADWMKVTLQQGAFR